MPTITTFGSAAARALGFTGRAKKLKSQSFIASGSSTWTCPPGVTQLETLTGKGGDGSGPYSYTASETLMSVSFINSTGGSPNTGNNWASFQAVGPNAISQINANQGGGIGGYFYKYADGTETLGTYSVALNTDPYWQVGSAYLVYSSGWKTSGPIVNGDSGTATAYYTRNIPGFNGYASTAFGQTFPGGPQGPAVPQVFTNIAVVPGTDYFINNSGTVAITITYYQ